MKIKGKVNGFTLLEIMIVLGIVALLSTLAVHNVLRSRMICNENTAINILVILRNACIGYFGSQTPPTFPEDLSDLTVPKSNPPFINATLMSSLTNQENGHQGYRYLYTPENNGQGFAIVARPVAYQDSGERSFLVDSYNRIYTTTENRPPNPATDPLL